jgi:hypothetical protein
MELRTTVLFALWFSVTTSLCAGASSLRELVAGMSKNEVMRVMGPPDALRLERNGVVCLTYEMHEHRLWSRLFGQRTHLVALKDDRLIDDATIRSERIRSQCSQIAARWDPPMRRPLICDDHRRTGC